MVGDQVDCMIFIACASRRNVARCRTLARAVSSLSCADASSRRDEGEGFDRILPWLQMHE